VLLRGRETKLQLPLQRVAGNGGAAEKENVETNVKLSMEEKLLERYKHTKVNKNLWM